MSAGQSPVQGHRRALVTGASSGIGEAFVERLARDGWDLVLVARSGPALEALAKELGQSHGVDIEVAVADLTEPEALHRIEAIAAREPLDLLVNNAGMGTAGAFAHSDVEREEREIQLNVTALVRLTRAALPGMLERDSGAIINVSSLAGMGPYPYTAVYGASKAFVNSFSEALVEELRGSGVKIQALCPGFIRTRFQERAGVDPTTVPGFAWMEAESVVDASLASLEKGEVICVPGLGYRVLSWVGGAAPRGVFRRVIGAAQASRYRDE